MRKDVMGHDAATLIIDGCHQIFNLVIFVDLEVAPISVPYFSPPTARVFNFIKQWGYERNKSCSLKTFRTASALPRRGFSGSRASASAVLIYSLLKLDR
jgi:hypothetical protein